MGAIPPDEFATELRRFERDRLAGFVADLWAAGGWETAIDGESVIVEREGERQLLAVTARSGSVFDRWRSPEIPDDADAVVRPDGTEGTDAEVPVIDASTLRDRLLFGLDADAADRICEAHLDVPARDGRWGPEPEPESETDPLPAASGGGRQWSRGRTMLVATGVLGFLVLVVGPGALLGAAPIDMPQPPGDSTGDAPEAVPVPTCERGPGEVAMTVGNVLQPPSEGASGLQVLWNFTDPHVRESRHYRSFRGFYAGPQFDPLREAETLVLDGVVRTSSEAAVFVIAPTEAWNVPYLFSMVERDRLEGSCWTIRSVAQSGDG
jgi:hypothetical protein